MTIGSRPVGGENRLRSIDGLRLFAALAVAMYHYTVSWRIDGVHPPRHFLPTFSQFSIYGFLGVELFFLISGFVICMSAWGRRLGDFVASRVTRLYPAYWVCVVITAAVVLLVPVTRGVPTATRPSAELLAVNLTMFQEPMGVPAMDTVYWTLWAEMRFYLLFAGLLWVGLTYRRAVLFCTVWLTISVIAPTLHSPLIDTVAIVDYAPYFIAGITMFLMRRHRPTLLLWGLVGFSWLVSLQRVGQRIADVHPGFPVPRWPAFVAITLAYAAMLVIALGWTDRITWRWLTAAGALTYPFYLLHQRIGYSIIRTGHEQTGAPAWVLVAGTIGVILALAWLVHRGVERPLAPRLRAGLRDALTDIRTTGEGPVPRISGAAPAVPVQRGPELEVLRAG